VLLLAADKFTKRRELRRETAADLGDSATPVVFASCAPAG
jgi:hypothetical protein